MLSLKWVSIVGRLLYCCLGLSQMVVAQTFDQDYADWKAAQVAQDQRLQNLSTKHPPSTADSAQPPTAPAVTPETLGAGKLVANPPPLSLTV